MIEDLLDIAQLMPLLGYSDPRSIIKWCKSKNIPIIKVGLKKYVLSHYLTQYIDNQLITFERVNSVDSLEVFKKIKEIEVQKSNIENNDAIKKEARSAVAMKFLNKLKLK